MRKWPGHVILSGSEESEVGHACRLVEPDASLPLSMTRERVFFTASQHDTREGLFYGMHAITNVPGRVMLSDSEASTWAMPSGWSPRMLSAAKHDMTTMVSHGMIHGISMRS